MGAPLSMAWQAWACRSQCTDAAGLTPARLFSHLKRILRMGRLRLRGPSGAQFEFTLAAIAQNLRRLAKLAFHPPDAAVMRVA